MTPREAEIKRQWRAKLEELGPDNVRSKLGNPQTTGPGDRDLVTGIFSIKIDIDGETRRTNTNRKFCEDWLAEKDREAKRRSSLHFWLTAIGAFAAAIGAIAAVIAAVASVLALFAE